jgi:competence protein ComEC
MQPLRGRRGTRAAALDAGGLAVAPGARFLTGRLRAALDLRGALLAEVDARRLFLWIPVGMGVGILLFAVAEGVPSPWPPLVTALLLFAVAFRARARLAPQVACAALGCVALGFGCMALRTEQVAAPVLDQTVFARLSGFVDTVDAGPVGGRMVLVVTGLETAFAVTRPERLRVTFKGPGPRAGDHVSGQARLMPPPQPAFPGGYDFARDAWFLRLGAVGRWVGPFAISPAPRPPGLGLAVAAAIDNARTDMTNRIARIVGGQAGALSAALVTGKRGLLEERVNDDLRASGLYHIVSISGLHMVLAAGVFFWLARALLALIPGVVERHPIKKWAAGLAMLGATAYCIFSGSEVATERSLVMTLVMLGAVLFDRPALSMRNLAIAAIIVLLREPETMAGPSFQMSFAAVAAMIAAHEWWASLPRAPREPTGWGGILIRRLGLVLAGSLATTLIASVATAPFAAFHFQRLNPYGLIGNALAIPFVSLIVMPSAVAGTLLMPFGLDGPIWRLMGVGSAVVVEVAAWVALIDGSVRGVRAFPVEHLLWMAAGFVLLVLVRTPLRLAGVALVALATIAAARTPSADVVIDRQGQVAGLRGADGRLVILGRASSRFTVDRWLAADGDLRKGNDPGLRTGTICDRAGCVGRLHNGSTVALVLQPEAFEEDCMRARLVVTPLTAPPFCARTALVVDRGSLSASASLALRLEGGRFIVSETRPPGAWKPWFGRPPTSPPPQTNAEASQPEAAAPDDGSDILTP